MPQQRVNQKFKDISMSFDTNPLNNDLIGLKDSSAIARSLRNIVFTLPGEKFFDENFGSRISATLFENIDDISAGLINDEIRQSINRYEPRVKLVSVKATPDYLGNAFDVVITYNIIGIDALPQQLNFALQSTR